MFVLHCTNDKIWNLQEFISYLVANQNQDIEIHINPEAIDLESLGAYSLIESFNFTSVKIVTSNQIEQHPIFDIVINNANIFLDTVPEEEAKYNKAWSQKKLFLTMFGRPSANRLALASYLHQNYKDKSILHFSAKTDIDSIKIFEFDKLSDFGISSLENTVKMLNSLPLMGGSTYGYNKFVYDFNDPLTNLYHDIFVDIVSESHVNGNTFFVTEKTTRPICMKRPFIVFASRDYLDYLHQQGFYTFNDFWTEEYDGYEHKERYEKIIKVIDFIASKSESELESMFSDMQSILDHNYNLLKSRSYKKQIKKIL